MQTANDAMNKAPRCMDGKSALSVFSSQVGEYQLEEFHTFGCPLFVLDTALQAGSQDRQVETTRTRGNVPRTVTHTCPIGGISAKFGNRTSIASIPHQV